MNEVSQGESGNQEYVEFVVVDTSVSYDCNATTPPCIDIRGWIFDDNSGWHGGDGIASGAIRFSFDPLWQCVPLGTIILIYNDAAPNPLVPAADVSLSDGNCTISAPISNPSLFETNSTTPGASACSYPATGWTPGGDWGTTLLANPSDCARIVNLAGCEVFSVCWNGDNQNNVIYFPGGATSGSSAINTVYYFNNGDPSVQTNWSIGCADVPACGQEDQTPGAPNNATNAAYIAQFNNNCTPITPLIATVTLDNDAICMCNGQATASASGSIPGYSYEWLDNSGISIGQTTATATGLCAGTYQVVVSSSIGCSETLNVVVGSSGTVAVNVNDVMACEGENITLSAIPSATGGSFLWTPNGETTQDISFTAMNSGTYSVEYTLGSCSASDNATVTVNSLPIVNAGIDQTVCEGDQIVLSGTGAVNLVWDNGVQDGVPFVTSTGMTTYTLTGTDANGCSNTDQVSITTNASPIADALVTPIIGSAPLNVTFENLSTGATDYYWDFDLSTLTTQNTVPLYYTYVSPGIYTITLIASNGNCTSTWNTIIEVINSAPVELTVPNVFTPNNDDDNDHFLINSQNLISLEGFILNRWGNVMMEFNTVDFTWDGKSNGKEASEGTYFIRYKAIGIDNSVLEGHTFFELIR